MIGHMVQEVSSHETNSHEINCHKINFHKNIQFVLQLTSANNGYSGSVMLLQAIHSYGYNLFLSESAWGVASFALRATPHQ